MAMNASWAFGSSMSTIMMYNNYICVFVPFIIKSSWRHPLPPHFQIELIVVKGVRCLWDKGELCPINLKDFHIHSGLIHVPIAFIAIPSPLSALGYTINRTPVIVIFQHDLQGLAQSFEVVQQVVILCEKPGDILNFPKKLVALWRHMPWEKKLTRRGGGWL